MNFSQVLEANLWLAKRAIHMWQLVTWFSSPFDKELASTSWGAAGFTGSNCDEGESTGEWGQGTWRWPGWAAASWGLLPPPPPVSRSLSLHVMFFLFQSNSWPNALDWLNWSEAATLPMALRWGPCTQRLVGDGGNPCVLAWERGFDL